MLDLSNLKPRVRKKARKRVGRGSGSGTGTYSGRGLKGQKARSGGNIKPGFEGGRMPLIRQLPKRRGFKSFKLKNQPVDIEKLAKLFPQGGKITPKILKQKGLILNANHPAKILGNGKTSVKFEIEGVMISAPARARIEQAGGSIKEIKQNVQ